MNRQRAIYIIFTAADSEDILIQAVRIQQRRPKASWLRNKIQAWRPAKAHYVGRRRYTVGYYVSLSVFQIVLTFIAATVGVISWYLPPLPKLIMVALTEGALLLLLYFNPFTRFVKRYELVLAG